MNPDKCMSWCLENGIRIYHVPKKKGEKDYLIEIEGKHFTSDFMKKNWKVISDVRYSPKESSAKIRELYCSIYRKNNPSVK